MRERKDRRRSPTVTRRFDPARRVVLPRRSLADVAARTPRRRALVSGLRMRTEAPAAIPVAIAAAPMAFTCGDVDRRSAAALGARRMILARALDAPLSAALAAEGCFITFFDVVIAELLDVFAHASLARASSSRLSV